jgi:hypothetical protein
MTASALAACKAPNHACSSAPSLPRIHCTRRTASRSAVCRTNLRASRLHATAMPASPSRPLPPAPRGRVSTAAMQPGGVATTSACLVVPRRPVARTGHVVTLKASSSRSLRPTKRSHPAIRQPMLTAQARPCLSCGLARFEDLLSVLQTDNTSRVRDGYINSGTRGHARACWTWREGPICRKNVIASAPAVPASTAPEMVRRGSAVRVRQRAFAFYLLNRPFRCRH